MTTNLSRVLSEAAELEQRAMTVDREGLVRDSIDLYYQTVEKLKEALSLCPNTHPDMVSIDRHISEIQSRISYLSSLSASAKPLIPLESHISPVELSLPSSQTMNQPSTGSTMGAAAAIGGVGGLMLLGPIGLLAGAAGAAYATTRSDTIGTATRGVARGSVAVVEKAVDVNREHHLTTRARELGSAAISRASEINQRYEVTDRVANAGSEAFKRLSTFNESYGVTDKIASGISSGMSTIANFLQPNKPPQAPSPPHQQFSLF